jgi:hypothetical protein
VILFALKRDEVFHSSYDQFVRISVIGARNLAALCLNGRFYLLPRS